MGLSSGIKLSWLWIKKLFEKCPKRRRVRKQIELFLLCGHRGSPIKEIENTIPSFELALSEGANSVETDLCITKDKVVVLWHDWNPNDTVALLREKGLEPEVKYKPSIPSFLSENRREISELTYEEFSNNYNYIEKEASIPANVKIPTLKEFFGWAAGQKRLKYIFLDLKTPSHKPDLALEIISQAKKLYDELNPSFKIIIETFNTKILLPLKENFPQFSYSFDVELHPGIVLLPRKYSSVKKALKLLNDVAIVLRPRIITIANWVTYRRLIRFEVRKQRRCNRKHPDKMIKFIIGCTINRESEMDCLVKLGIDGMQTDYPERLSAVVQKYNLNI